MAKDVFLAIQRIAWPAIRNFFSFKEPVKTVRFMTLTVPLAISQPVSLAKTATI
jgi:hypothetical protein